MITREKTRLQARYSWRTKGYWLLPNIQKPSHENSLPVEAVTHPTKNVYPSDLMHRVAPFVSRRVNLQRLPVHTTVLRAKPHRRRLLSGIWMFWVLSTRSEVSIRGFWTRRLLLRWSLRICLGPEEANLVTSINIIFLIFSWFYILCFWT